MTNTHRFSHTVRKLYLAHYATPFILEAGLIVSTATDLVESMRGTVLITASKKQRHTKIFHDLITILDTR